jgi:hypothetical protein
MSSLHLHACSQTLAIDSAWVEWRTRENDSSRVGGLKGAWLGERMVASQPFSSLTKAHHMDRDQERAMAEWCDPLAPRTSARSRSNGARVVFADLGERSTAD